MFKFAQIRYWIFAGYLLPVIMSVISGVIISNHVQEAIEYAKKLTTSFTIRENLGDLEIQVQGMSSNIRGYLIQKNTDSLKRYNKAKTRYKTLANNLDLLITDEQHKEIFEEINELTTKLILYHQELINLIDANQVEAAIQKWRIGVGRDLSDQISDQLDAFIKIEQEIVQTSEKQQEEDLRELANIVWINTAISLFAVLGIGIFIISIIVKKINQQANAIASAVTQIAITIEEQEKLAIQQGTSVNQTTTSIDELAASSRQSAEQAQAASTGANQVLVLASRDQNTKQHSLKDKIGKIKSQIMRLSEHLSQISTVTNIVSDLANQTNMLALNASVEAVRAGEHGKGFGVVALEIRKLADKSRKSAEKINSLIIDIQNATTSTVIVTEEGTQAVENIVEAINDVAVNIQQISLNAQQQATAIQQIGQAMNNLNKAAQETTGGISQTKIGTQQLNQTALSLRDMI